MREGLRNGGQGYANEFESTATSGGPHKIPSKKPSKEKNLFLFEQGEKILQAKSMRRGGIGAAGFVLQKPEFTCASLL